MKILVDTSVWSLALRRAGSHTQKELQIIHNLTELIHDGRVVMIGPIRQELLSGISSAAQFEKLKNHLSHYPDMPLKIEIDVKAAEYFNICRKAGVQGSHTDFLICAVATEADLAIFTSDNDFSHYANHIPIKLYISGAT